MNCPHCGVDGGAKVLETRGAYRRRRCLACGETFVTLETVAEKNCIPGMRPDGYIPVALRLDEAAQKIRVRM